MIQIKIPKIIKILTHNYTVRFDEKELASAGCSGLARHLYQDIILSNRIYPPSELNQVFLHEVIHTIERHFGIKIDDADVDRLSEGLCVFLFDNLGIGFDYSDIEIIE